MKSNALPSLVVCVALSACGGGGGGGAPSANVTVSFPNLFQQGSDQVLPTYISHVIASGRRPLAHVTIANTGPAASMQVTIDLPNYGQPGSQTVAVAAAETKSIDISPAIDFAQLFANTTALPALLNVSVKAGGTTVFQQSYPIQLSGRDTVFWTSNGQPLHPLTATMVTPNDRNNAIALLLRNAAPMMPTGQVLGYQLAATWPVTSYTLSPPWPNTYQQEPFYLLQGESPNFTIDSVVITSSGAPDVISMFIMNDANFQAWVAGSTTTTACGINNAAGAGSSVGCSAQPAGTYHIVYYNNTSPSVARTVRHHRLMTKFETTYSQTQAIFQQLRTQGMIYVNVPGGTSYFSSSQNVNYPSESLALASANCVEGALVFASAWEKMGMKPFLLFGPGHAFAAVSCWSDSTNCFIPVETTMVGGTSSFAAAYNTGVTEWSNWSAASTGISVDIAAARGIGLTPAPM